MKEFIIKLNGIERDDGKICIVGEGLPMFNVIGDDDKEALAKALDLLPEYLRHNVPHFVRVRQASDVSEVVNQEEAAILPAHIIAEAGDCTKDDNSTTS